MFILIILSGDNIDLGNLGFAQLLRLDLDNSVYQEFPKKEVLSNSGRDKDFAYAKYLCDINNLSKQFVSLGVYLITPLHCLRSIHGQIAFA